MGENNVHGNYMPVLDYYLNIPVNVDKGVSYRKGFLYACEELGLQYKLRGKNLLIYDPRFAYKILGGLADMTPSIVSIMAVRIANNKDFTYEILQDAGISVPKQVKFSVKELDEAYEFFKTNPIYSVMKPSNGKGGGGITVGVDLNYEAFMEAWEYCKKHILGAGHILLEELVEGFDVRAIMIGENLSCAVSRIPPHIIGDGTSTIEELIHHKNEIRKKHFHHKRFLIKNNKSNKVLEKNEIYFLSNISNIHQGGEAVDITDLLGINIKNYLARIMKSIPGLNVAGIDLLIKDFDCLDSLKVIEINVSPNYEIHYVPYKGHKRNPARDYVCYLKDKF